MVPLAKSKGAFRPGPSGFEGETTASFRIPQNFDGGYCDQSSVGAACANDALSRDHMPLPTELEKTLLGRG